MFRLPPLMIAATLALPLPALAAEDCGARIAALENSPVFAEQPSEEGAETQDEASGGTSDSGSAESAADEQAENGVAVEENDGTTVYQEGGPAMPRENWFGSPPDKAKILEHLEAAKQAQSAGDHAACNEEVTQAEKIFARETQEEQEQDSQAQ